MEEMVTFKLINSQESSVQNNLTMLSQKAKNEIKVPDLPSLHWNFKDKERRMKQTTKVNLVQS